MLRLRLSRARRRRPGPCSWHVREYYEISDWFKALIRYSVFCFCFSYSAANWFHDPRFLHLTLDLSPPTFSAVTDFSSVFPASFAIYTATVRSWKTHKEIFFFFLFYTTILSIVYEFYTSKLSAQFVRFRCESLGGVVIKWLHHITANTLLRQRPLPRHNYIKH